MHKNEIKSILEGLTYREREIFKLRTGLADGYTYTYDEIGRIFRRSRSTAYRVYRNAEEKVLSGLAASYDDEKEVLIEVSDVVSQARTLTPYLIAHLKNNDCDLRRLPWDVFEHLIAEFFASWGYENVRLVGRDSSTSADIIAMKKPGPDGTMIRYFIEVKRWKDRVGVEVVERVLGAILSERQQHGWHLGMIVASGGFKEMRKFNKEQYSMLGIELRDGHDISKWLEEYHFSKKGLWLPNPFL